MVALLTLSWLNGYQKQYGFVYVDHQQNRARKRKRVISGTKTLLPAEANSVNLPPSGAVRHLIWCRIFLNFFLRCQDPNQFLF